MFRRLFSRKHRPVAPTAATSRLVANRMVVDLVERLQLELAAPTAPAALPAHLLPMPGVGEVAYDPASGALVRVPAVAHRRAAVVSR